MTGKEMQKGSSDGPYGNKANELNAKRVGWITSIPLRKFCPGDRNSFAATFRLDC